MGATDGVIMPIIITAHIANMNAKCQADHGMNSGDIMPDMSKPVASQHGVAQRERGDREQRDADNPAVAAARDSGRVGISR